MAGKIVSKEMVFEAARELIAAGESPSILAIHKRLGRGSNTTIAKYRKEFLESDEAKEAATANLPIVAELPGEFEEEATHFVKKIWQMAKAVSDSQLEAEREALSTKHTTMQQEVAEAVDFADAVARERDEFQETIESQAQEAHKLRAEISSLQNDWSTARAEIERLEGELVKAGVSADMARTELAESTREGAALKQERNDLKAQLEETQKSHAIELERLHTQNEKETTRLISQSEKATKAVETQHQRAITDLQKQHDNATNATKIQHQQAITDLQKQHDNATEQLVEQHKKSNIQLEDVMVDLRKQRDQAQAEVTKARSELLKVTKAKGSASKPK